MLKTRFIPQTLALSYMCGTISRFVFGVSTNTPGHFLLLSHHWRFFGSYYDTKAVFLAMGITALVCLAVTVFCFQTKVRG